MDEISQELSRIVGEVFGVSSEIEITVTPAPSDVPADFASNVAMQLTRVLHKAPAEIASQIVENWGLKEFSIEVAGPGFLNFIASDAYFKHCLTDLYENFEENISWDGYSGETVICEFSDPNPFKVLHVGHLYTSIVGDAIARLMEFGGARVIRANFGGDVGLHVAKTLYAVMKNEIAARELDAEVLAKCYVEGTRAYEEDSLAHEEIVRLNKEIYRIVQAGPEVDDTVLGDGGAAVAKLYWRGREKSYDYFREFYRRIGVEFDKYYPESSVADRGLREVLGHPDVYVDSDGAKVFHGEDWGLHTRVFVNKEGLPTYEAKDVGLIFTKWDDYKFDRSVVITGNEIVDYMKVVLKSVEQYAPELVEKTRHLTHGLVKLPGAEKMSSRKGNFLRAVDVLEAVERELPEGTDEKVMLGATKYALLKYKVGGEIEFDIKSSVATTGNSGVYLMYSVVRAKKILGGLGNESKGSWKMSDAEKELVRKMGEYKYVLREAAGEMAPHKVAGYLYELAQEFSRFYEKVKVVGSEHEYERGRIVAVYARILEHGLGLMGIEAPEEM